MGESDLTSANVMNKLLRMIFAALDFPAYWLLGVAYKLFFNVASVDLFSSDTIMKFYGRVQVILGVFMMFQLSLTILKGIADPDSFVGEKGSGKVIVTKIITALILLTVMMPISIPSPKNEYEKQINNNGLLFGTLYSLQHRILSNNTLGRLILGTTGTSNTYKASSSNDDDLAKSSRIFTSTILKGFYRINLVPEEERDGAYLRENKDPAAYNENRVCKDISDDALEKYTRLDGDTGEIINLVYETCTVDFNVMNYIPVLSSFAGSKKYAFTQMPIISTIVAIVFVFILLSFTVDIAVRAVKLAVLRLIAPIPIISYMDPKGSKDGAFNQWVKTLTSTYLDLFIRLAVIYFVIFIIQDTMIHGIVMDAGSGIYKVLTYVAIYIGLFIFAKQAPKFFRQVLGMKEDGGKLFSGFGEIMGAAALGTGVIGSMHASREASRQADIANGKDPTTLLNKGKHILSGIGGGVSGAITGMGAWQGAKDHQGKAVSDAMQKRNTTAMEKGLSGSTLFGRAGATATRAFRGDGATAFDAETRGIQQKKDIEKSAKDLFSYLEGKGQTDGAGYRVTTDEFAGQANGVDFSKRTFTGSLNELSSAKQQALADQQAGRGDGTFMFDGIRFRTTDASVKKLEEELAYAAGDMWAQGSGSNDSGFIQKQATYNESIKGADDPNGSGLYVEYQAGGSHTASRLKKTSKAAGGEAVRGEVNPGYKRRQANYGASKKS